MCLKNFKTKGKVITGVNSLPTGVKTLENYFESFESMD